MKPSRRAVTNLISGLAFALIVAGGGYYLWDQIPNGASNPVDQSVILDPIDINIDINVRGTECISVGILSTEGCADYERIVSYLKSAEIAYNRPTQMTLGTAQDIVLLLDLEGKGGLSAALVGTEGAIVADTVPAARGMSADLNGSAFEIEPRGPHRQGCRYL